MKKIFLTVALAVGVAGVSCAQGIKYGVKAGTSLTNFTGSDVSGTSYKFGFMGGVLANFGFNDMISIQPEVLYSMKGFKYSNSSESVHANYIDVPVLVKVATGATGLFFELGPQVGFLAAANGKANGTSQDIRSSFNNVDFGYAGGIGFQAASGPMIGLRYNGGFTHVFTSNSYSTPFTSFTTTSNAKNSAFQLYVGYTFGGK